MTELVRPPASKQAIELARSEYEEEGLIQIDDDALASEFEGGCWVEAWVYVYYGWADDDQPEEDDPDEEA